MSWRRSTADQQVLVPVDFAVVVVPLLRLLRQPELRDLTLELVIYTPRGPSHGRGRGEYGAPLVDRTRLACEVIAAVK